jgi:hypothetical protein
MINPQAFKQLPYEEKITALQEIFAQIHNPSENLKNIQYYLDIKFPYQEETLTSLFDLVYDVSVSGKKIDDGLLNLVVHELKTESDQQQSHDNAQADKLISWI